MSLPVKRRKAAASVALMLAAVAASLAPVPRAGAVGGVRRLELLPERP